ncbi:hypothetical protein [Leptolyngbya sp. FACHB-711]|uniref:hypothetical protein n=1 Tax=unclassified Leptolyngbya TaxID=2650499 RepID=UPI00168483FA|nr:hypothetical protein [Leptolyngbya sp. FACHB-711]MBD1851085.1 hypothetical protein [Cyanobacteria bacterium FACHB-502]MBD2025057.1 hypothetical protein [Leptolyngbya sp. FACHB-711]
MGIWQGEFEGVSGNWLRWCDRSGEWLLTDTEQARRAENKPNPNCCKPPAIF